MTDVDTTDPHDTTDPSGTDVAADSGVPRRRGARLAVLLAVFVCAACGLVYELALVALGSYLIGDTVGQASIVLSLMVFAMGVGALAAKPLQRRAASAFAVVEIVLALLGGLSVLLLYAAFAWIGMYTQALIVMALLLGALIGAEIPLLMELLQRIRRQAAGSAVADLFAADYVGALIGGLAFPFLLLPVFGQIQGALVVGAVNAAAGLGLVLSVFRTWLSRTTRWVLSGGAVAVIAVLAVCYVYADSFEVTARQALYSDPVVQAERSQYQEIVLTEASSLSGRDDMRLFLNGDLQFSTVDEYRYHEALVHPAMSGPHKRVLILGGGDGLALREVLRYDDVEQADLVELDPTVVNMVRDTPKLRQLNNHSFTDDRVDVEFGDAFQWLRHNSQSYDTIIVDMPGPDSTSTAKLYSVEFYALAARTLTDDGSMVVQSGSPYFAPKSYWSIEASLRKAGLDTTPYHMPVPSFGQWGYHLAAKDSSPQVRLPESAPSLRSLDQATLRAATVFPADRRRIADVPASTLMHPRILDFAQQEWRDY